jgi:amidase
MADVATTDAGLRVGRDRIAHAYDAAATPVGEVVPGSTVVFATHDARAGSLLDRPTGTPYELPLPPGKGNPVTGPVAVTGARPGDAVVVTIRRIELGPVGWCGGHAHVGPVPVGRVPRPIARTCEVRDGHVVFGPDLSIPLRPMVGCVGTAPRPGAGAVSTAYSGPHGGNMDQPVVAEGARVWLPVAVDGALVSLGDVHACQGDGELSGVALEAPAEVTVTIDLVPGAGIDWPWVELPDGRVAVCTVAPTWSEARSLAVDAAMRAVERDLGLEAGDALGLVSLVGDLRPGGSWGGPQENARVELPAALGVGPVAGAAGDRQGTP